MLISLSNYIQICSLVKLPTTVKKTTFLFLFLVEADCFNVFSCNLMRQKQDFIIRICNKITKKNYEDLFIFLICMRYEIL